MLNDEQARNERLAALRDYNDHHPRPIMDMPLTSNQCIVLFVVAMFTMLVVTTCVHHYYHSRIPVESRKESADVIGAARHYENTRGSK